MKTRLICLLLGLITVLSLVLTSCSGVDDEKAEENISNAASENALTLTMWVVSDKKVSETTAAAVTDALNSITKAKFKTQLVVNFKTAAEYRDALTEEINAYLADRAKSGIKEEATTEAENASGNAVTDETMTNQYGMSVIKYPDAKPHQVDIVYIAGEDMYSDFIDRGWLSALDSELAQSSKKIKEYVSPTLLSAAKRDGVTYAVPNNNIIGEYTYMLVDKQLADKYYQQGYLLRNKINGFYNRNLYNFVDLIHKFEPDVVPVDSTYDFCRDLLAYYWSMDPQSYDLLNEFSVFGYHYTDITSLSRGSVILGYNSLFEDPSFTEGFLKLNEMKQNNCIVDAKAAGKRAAIKFVTGDSTVLDQYNAKVVDSQSTLKGFDGKEYYAVVVKYPTATDEDIYGNMFGVCTYTRSLSRSMEVVTYLNTNVTFRNLLQYGIPNVHYRMEQDETTGTQSLVRLNNDYLMKIEATGNQFIAYPEAYMSPDIWENGKVQNRGALVDPMTGFVPGSFAVTEAAGDETVSIDSTKGYNLSYRKTLSKEILSQNPEIKAWMDSCTEKGIHVLKTAEVQGQNTEYQYYIFNTAVSPNADFSVTELRETETTKDASDESNVKKSTAQRNLDFTLTYSGSGAGTGGLLSSVSILTKKNNNFDLLASINGKEEAVRVTELDHIVLVDDLNNDAYSVEIYPYLTKAGVWENGVISDWITNECDQSKATGTYLYTFHDEETGVDTIMVYRNNLKFPTTLDVVPSLTGDTLTLNMLFGNTSYVEGKLNSTDEKDSIERKPRETDKEKLGETDINYVLFYIRVKAGENVTLKYNASMFEAVVRTAQDNIETEEERSGGITRTSKYERIDGSYKKENINTTEGTVDPAFTLCGNLDTELIKYISELNRILVDKINNCAYADLPALVDEIGRLLNTDPEKNLRKADFTLLTDVITGSLVQNDLSRLHSNVCKATSFASVKKVDEEGNELLWREESEDVDAEIVSEPYVYYDSPYALYYKWMEKYNYLPKTKDKDKGGTSAKDDKT